MGPICLPVNRSGVCESGVQSSVLTWPPSINHRLITGVSPAAASLHRTKECCWLLATARIYSCTVHLIFSCSILPTAIWHHLLATIQDRQFLVLGPLLPQAPKKRPGSTTHTGPCKNLSSTSNSHAMPQLNDDCNFHCEPLRIYMIPDVVRYVHTTF